MIVRGTATAAKQSHRVLLALPYCGHARSSAVERSPATNEAAEAECSHPRSVATTSVVGLGTNIAGVEVGTVPLSAEATASTAAETKGSSKRVMTRKDDELTSSTAPEQSL